MPPTQFSFQAVRGTPPADSANTYPPSPGPLYPDDQLSTASVRFLASEIIREKLFLALDQELPYNVAVEVGTWEEVPEHPARARAVVT